MINSNTYEQKTEYVKSLNTDIIMSLVYYTVQNRNNKWEELTFYLRELANRGEVEFINSVIKELEIQLSEAKTYANIANDNKKVL